MDPIQVELLIGKAYLDWGHVNDVITIYDQLIISHPDDFWGCLSKGIILKENGNVGVAERMFIQARIFIFIFLHQRKLTTCTQSELHIL